MAKYYNKNKSKSILSYFTSYDKSYAMYVRYLPLPPLLTFYALNYIPGIKEANPLFYHLFKNDILLFILFTLSLRIALFLAFIEYHPKILNKLGVDVIYHLKAQ